MEKFLKMMIRKGSLDNHSSDHGLSTRTSTENNVELEAGDFCLQSTKAFRKGQPGVAAYQKCYNMEHLEGTLGGSFQH